MLVSVNELLRVSRKTGARFARLPSMVQTTGNLTLFLAFPVLALSSLQNIVTKCYKRVRTAIEVALSALRLAAIELGLGLLCESQQPLRVLPRLRPRRLTFLLRQLLLHLLHPPANPLSVGACQKCRTRRTVRPPLPLCASRSQTSPDRVSPC